MQAPPNTSKPRVLCPRGLHLARCVQVVDLGTQHFKEGDNGSRKLYLGFETCQTRHTFKEENGPEPFMLQKEFAWFMTSAKAEKTKLRQFIVQWFGKDFPDEVAAQSFDFSKLLGFLAMLTIAHKPKTDGDFKNDIADIYMPTPEQRAWAGTGHNKRLCYEISMGQNEVFAELPDFLKKKIMESDEMRGIGQRVALPAAVEAPAPVAATSAAAQYEIPF